MYATSAHIYNFKCIGKAVLKLQHPGKEKLPVSSVPNVNLILGDNGAGKSSVLRAIAIAMLAPALMETGFISYRFVRRPGEESSLLKVKAFLGNDDSLYKGWVGNRIDLLARIDRSINTDYDKLTIEKTPDSPLEKLIYDESSHAFFVVGYGATRRMETGDYSPSNERKRRGVRYGRVASLFEEQIALQPLELVISKFKNRRDEALDLINQVLPDEVRIVRSKLHGPNSQADDSNVMFNEVLMPFSSLSDGYRAFVAMIADLVGNIASVCPKGMSFNAVPGIVLIDEVDLHLHPAWQRSVVGTLARCFPALQFIMTSHSPLIANSIQKENIFITDLDDDGTSTVTQFEEQAYGRSIDQLLLSSYFGLSSTRPSASTDKTERLVEQVQAGDKYSALDVMQRIGSPNSHDENISYYELAKQAAKKDKR